MEIIYWLNQMIFRNPYSFSAVNWNWNLEIDWSKHVGTVIHSYLKPMRMNINTALLNSCVSPQTIPDIISSLTVNELQCDSQRGQDSTGPLSGWNLFPDQVCRAQAGSAPARLPAVVEL